MSKEENKAIFQRMIDEVWNKGNLDAADEFFAADHTSPDAPDLPPGPEGVRQIVSMFLGAFPDLQIEIEDLIATEDRVCGRMTERGTHKGDLMEIPPTGKDVEFSEIAIIRIADGKIAESWYQPDMLTLMQQLEVIPAFGEQPAPAPTGT
jgi:steroid delta-isomerase-like uncharacterized protein